MCHGSIFNTFFFRVFIIKPICDILQTTNNVTLFFLKKKKKDVTLFYLKKKKKSCDIVLIKLKKRCDIVISEYITLKDIHKKKL